MSRPSSLFLTSIVWKERNISQYKSNINSALVIEEFLKHSYSRQENKGNKSALSIYERSYFMEGIAVGMTIKNRYTNQITQVELKDMIIKLYNDFPEEITKQILDNQSYVKKLQKRFDNKYNIETILLDIRSCGILVRDLSTFDSFKFAHKSFLELLVSKYITNSFINLDTINFKHEILINNSISKSLECSPNQLSKTPDVIKFIAEQSIRILDFKDNLDEKGKIRHIFKYIYPFSFLNMEKVFKLILLFGRDIRIGLVVMIYNLSTSFILSYTITKFLYNQFVNYKIEQAILILIVVLIFAILSTLFYTIFNKILKTLHFRQMIELIFSQNPKKLFKEKLEIYFDSNILYDKGNLLLLFLICKELNMLNTLNQLMPTKLFAELILQEKYLYWFKDGHKLTDEELKYITNSKLNGI